MRVSDHLLARLAAEGITHGFGVYGGAVAEIFDAFTRTDHIRYVCPHHEVAAAHMAEGYAKASGKPGFAFATSGPGGQNMVTGCANCFFDSVPCIFITGQVQTKFMRPNNRVRQLGFQEWDAVACVREITKYAEVIRDPKRFPVLLDHAIWLCKSGRPGPVWLDVPGDVAKAEI